MQAEHFKQMVARLERESAAAPRAYRARVAALALLGFAILALMLSVVGAGLALLVGFVIATILTGGAALLLLLKLGKLLFLLAIPLWFLVKASVRALFVRLPAPQGREVTRVEAPALFAAMDEMRQRMKGPLFHHVLIVEEVNAAAVQRPAFGLIGFPRNYLLLGLPLLESLAPAEALAVVAHEYGHLAGSHGRFSAFIYRLRNTWGTVQAFAEQVRGWLGRLVAPLVRWYAPYFNAYTFVLARADEYQADAAAAELVGPLHAAHALKRVNVIAPRHQRFLEQTFDRIVHESAPPADLMQRWAVEARRAVGGGDDADVSRWLGNALDREGHFADTHPTLRARLWALQALQAPAPAEAPEDAPPAIAGPTAAEAWLGELLGPLRDEFQRRWVQAVQEPWSERHAQAQRERARLAELRAQPARDADEEIEALRLALRLERESDLRAPLVAFNAAHADHALGLYLEGTVRLDHGEAAGLELLERAMALDAEAIKPACERAFTFLRERKHNDAAEAWAERWRSRDQLEAERRRQMDTLDAAHELTPPDLSADELATVQALLQRPGVIADIAAVHIARRVLPADASVRTFVLGIELTWWGRQRNRQRAVVERLAALEWPVSLLVATLEGDYKGLTRRLHGLQGARLHPA